MERFDWYYYEYGGIPGFVLWSCGIASLMGMCFFRLWECSTGSRWIELYESLPSPAPSFLAVNGALRLYPGALHSLICFDAAARDVVHLLSLLKKQTLALLLLLFNFV